MKSQDETLERVLLRCTKQLRVNLFGSFTVFIRTSLIRLESRPLDLHATTVERRWLPRFTR